MTQSRQRSASATATDSPRLRKFNAIHIDKDYTKGFHGFHENELFFNCKFKDVRNLTLKDCDLNQSQFLTENLEEALGFTLTLGDCHSFEDVQYSEFMVKLYLVMAIKTAGNTELRKKLIDLLGHDTVIDILRQFKRLEGTHR